MSQPHSFKYDPGFMEEAGPRLTAGAQRTPLAVHDVQAHRDMLAAVSEIVAASAPKVDVTINTHKIQTRDGAIIDIAQVTPNKREVNGPSVVHAHGGGMMSGSAQSFVETGMLGKYAVDSGVTFFSVDYRVAPEHQLDGLVNDTYDGLAWVQKNAAALGIDPARIGLMGESAGGGIAAGVALQARDRKLTPAVCKQILIYPMLEDRNLVPDERIPMASASYSCNITGWSALLGKGIPGTDKVPQLVKYAVPSRVEDLSGLPGTFVDIGQFDIFLLENLDYARRLHVAGVQVDFHLRSGLPHSWDLMTRQTEVGRRAHADRIAALKSF